MSYAILFPRQGQLENWIGLPITLNIGDRGSANDGIWVSQNK